MQKSAEVSAGRLFTSVKQNIPSLQLSNCNVVN